MCVCVCLSTMNWCVLCVYRCDVHLYGGRGVAKELGGGVSRGR